MADRNLIITKPFVVGMKKAYDKAVSEQATQFTYNGHEFVTEYAKYFLQHHAPKFKVKL